MDASLSGRDLKDWVRSAIDRDRYRELHWEGTFWDYLKIVEQNPLVVRNAFQRIYDMILMHGVDERQEGSERIVKYRFFEDPIGGGEDALYGLDKQLGQLVSIFKSGAYGYGTERRILLLHGPVGSAKSTIARLLKKGIEEYSRRPEGALYTFGWRLEDESRELIPCPMHEEPLRLLPPSARVKLLKDLNKKVKAGYRLEVNGELDPACRYRWNQLMDRTGGDIEKVLEHVTVRRLLLSEKDRVGIGTFQPKDEKNQDSTELTGDINYRKIAEYGTDSDPRAFNFDGEFNIANRGIVEFIEVLKLDVAFLYELLGASQEHVVKPKKFAQTDIDEVIIGHTNEPEYKKLLNNELMEAFRDRTVKIDIPYNTVLSAETRIYEKEFNAKRLAGRHLAPHTVEVASIWAILSRVEEPKKANLTLLQKMKLYNGKNLAGFTKDNIRELREEAPREGMEGISPRYIQDKISNALVADSDNPCVNPFMVMNELETGLSSHSLISSEDVRKRYRDLLTIVRQEYEDLIKNEVQRAIAADEEAIARLCGNYIDNVKAYTQRERVRNRITARDEEPDERLMRSIEEKINIPEARKDDFRREIMNYIGALAIEGRTFDYRTNERLHRALELKLFEDQKDSIKLTSLVSSVVDRDQQEKIEVVKSRLIKNYGYCEVCASDVLQYVASIFARGDAKEDS
ncbi:MAG: serine protein kinase [Planctomycetes bacterium]|nr:serine protein kinase [Planctomycetota bacterium]